MNVVSVCERAKPFGVKQDRDNKRGGGYHVGRKWLGLFVCQAFVCFPVGQIYLGGNRSEACRWKLARRMARYTVIDSCFGDAVMEPDEKLINLICQECSG